MKEFIKNCYATLPGVEFWITHCALAIVGFVFLGLDPVGTIGLTGLGFASIAILATGLILIVSIVKAFLKAIKSKP